MEQAKAICPTTQRQSRAIRIIGFGLPLSAMIAACCICFSSKMPVLITYPVVLLIASLFTLVPFKSATSIKTLQKIIVFYLVSSIVNELSSQYFKIPFLPFDMSMSCSTIVLSLCTVGYFVGKAISGQTDESMVGTGILCSWALAMTIIMGHMVLLSLLLSSFYGYGYERDLVVLGNLCLYFLLFILLWKRLDVRSFRQGMGLILTLFFSVVIVSKVGI